MESSIVDREVKLKEFENYLFHGADTHILDGDYSKKNAQAAAQWAATGGEKLDDTSGKVGKKASAGKKGGKGDGSKKKGAKKGGINLHSGPLYDISLIMLQDKAP